MMPLRIEGTAQALPFGMTLAQWEMAVATGWLGMDDVAVSRLGVRAPWKGTPDA